MATWWDDETSADRSWWASAVRTLYGDQLANTLTDAYNKVRASGDPAAAALVDKIKQDTAEDLRKRAEAAGTAEARRLAAEAEKRITKKATQSAWSGAFVGVVAVALVFYLFLKK